MGCCWRTDPAALKHCGITAFIVNMKAAASRRPIRTMMAAPVQRSLFFRRFDLRQRSAGAARSGVAGGLDLDAHERMKAGKALARRLKKMLDIARTPGSTALLRRRIRVRERIADNWAQEQALRLLSFRAQTALSRRNPGPE